MSVVIGSLDEHVLDEFETVLTELVDFYIARRSAETDAEYGWPAGTTAALWDTQHTRWHEFDGEGQQR